MPRQSDAFPVTTFAGLNPDCVDLDRDSKQSTALFWTLHLRILAGGAAYVSQCGGQIKALSNDLTQTQPVFDYTGGDSYAEWAEPYDEDLANETFQPGRALHLYFQADDVAQAIIRARMLCAVSPDFSTHLKARNATLSTAGDWADQAEVWSD